MVAETLKHLPGLNSEGLKAAALYYDAQAEYAERLAVENAISAREHGAVVLNYARVDRLIVQNEDVRGVEFTDVLDGQQYKVQSLMTVNVADPWVDEVLAGTNGEAERMIGGTKGTHLVVDTFPGAPRTAIYYEAESDSRPIFVFPWNGRYLIGTTDIRYEGDLDYIVGDEEEISYLLKETNALIPQANLTRDDVLFIYSGVRPLPYNPQGSEGSVTRSHLIHDHSELEPGANGLLSIVGGKLTTYRNLSRQTVNEVYKKLGTRAPKCVTDRVPLPGGAVRDFEEFSAEFEQRSGLPETSARRLLKLYGARAYNVLAETADDPSPKNPLASPATIETGLLGCEILYAFRHEMARTLADVLLRRSMVGMGPNVGLDVDEAAAQVAVRHLAWTPERATREVADYRRYVERFKPRSLSGARVDA